MDIKLLAERHMRRTATRAETEHLNNHKDEWRKELMKLLNRYHAELSNIKAKQLADTQKYADSPDLQIEAHDAWEKKRLKAARRLRMAEYDLTLLDQASQVQTGPPMSKRELFLTAAIEAHRDFNKEVRPVDEHLYNALDGKWTFTELPPDLLWQE